MLNKLNLNSDSELRMFEESDARVLCDLIDKNRLYLREWLPWLDSNLTALDSEKFIQFAQSEFVSNVGMVFGIWKNEILIGVCSYQKMNKSNRSANIGYWIGKEYSGQGFAKLATNKLIEVAFSELKLHRIEIRCALGNRASQRVAESCGLKLEGVSRQCEWLYDHFVDHKIYAVLSTDLDVIL